MTTAQDVIARAQRWLGTAERPLGSNHVPGITDWYGIGNGAWCAMFVSRVFFDAGLPLPATTSRGFAYCPSGIDWFVRQGRWTSQPAPGRVVFFRWPGETRASHVGIVESVNPDGSIHTIEGNTNSHGSSEGLYVMRQVRRSFILGYGSPAFGGSVVAAAAPVKAPSYTPAQLTVEGIVADMPVVQQGTQGQYARIAQALLVANGRTVTVDGDFGPESNSNLREWQTAAGLAADGVCGPVTWRRLMCV